MINSPHIPENENFVKADILMNSGRRHLILATEFMLNLMSNAFTWWVDATFKLVKAPFTQLWAVHVFIKHDNCLKQVFVAFVLMSGKSTLDYEAVFKKLQQLRPNNQVTTVVADFEAATWRGAKNVFKTQISMKGCFFHFAQAVWRKIVNTELVKDYHSDTGTRHFCKKLMSLPLIPYNKINQVYEELLSEYPLTPKLSNLCTYFERVWLNSKVFTPESWSWFNEPIRTNNDVEGSHRRLNTRAQHNTLPFYPLMELLGEESSYVDYQHAMVASDTLSRNVSKRQSERQCILFELWFQYFNKELTPMELLCEIFDSTEPSKEWNSNEVVAAEDDLQ